MHFLVFYKHYIILVSDFISAWKEFIEINNLCNYLEMRPDMTVWNSTFIWQHMIAILKELQISVTCGWHLWSFVLRCGRCESWNSNNIVDLLCTSPLGLPKSNILWNYNLVFLITFFLKLSVFLAVRLFLLGHPAELLDKVIISLLNRGAAIRFVCLFAFYFYRECNHKHWLVERKATNGKQKK
jgi:nitrite reductase/ring-hydroxylating ferredoxin subunit